MTLPSPSSLPTLRLRVPLWRIALSLWLVSVSLPVTTEARAQDEGDATLDAEGIDAPLPSSAEVAPDKTLTATHLGELSALTRGHSRRVRRLLLPNEDVTDLLRALPQVESDVQRGSTPAFRAQIPQLSQRELGDTRQQWRRLREQLEAWQGVLGERAGKLADARGELSLVRRSWSTCLDASEAAGRPEGIHGRIVAALESLTEADGQLAEEFEHVQDLEERVGGLTIIAEEVSDDLRAAAVAYRERLFVQDRKALWVGLGVLRGRDTVAAQMAQSWRDRTDTSIDLLVQQSGSVVGALGVFAALLVALTALARVRHVSPEDPRLAPGRAMLSRRGSLALLATLSATPLLVEHPPMLLYDGVLLLFVVPCLRVLGPLVRREVWPLVWIACAFLVFDRLSGMAAESSEIRRISLLLESAAAAAAWTVWLVRAPGVSRWLRGAIALCVLVSAASLVANVFGYVFLASLLMRATGYSVHDALMGLALFLAFRALFDFIRLSNRGERLTSLREHGDAIQRHVMRWVGVAVVFVWARAALSAYGLRAPLTAYLEEVLGAPRAVGSLSLSLGGVLLFVTVLFLTSQVMRIVRFFMETDLLPRLKLEPGIDGAISGLTRYVLFCAGLLIALASIGIDASQIALVAGALGVGVGFGLQSIVSNIVAGFILMLERPVRLGDFIEIGSLSGRVSRIGVRSSTVRAPGGAEVIVPNETLISRELTNWTLSDRRRRVELKVAVAYGADPQRVLEILQGVTAAVSTDEGTHVVALFEGFGESTLDFAVQFWISDFSDLGEWQRLRSDVGLRIHDALRAAGVQLGAPSSG